MKKVDMFNAVNRQGTYTTKYDDAKKKFGTEDLLPLWVADMDLASPLCVQETLKLNVLHIHYMVIRFTLQHIMNAIQKWMQKRFDWNYRKKSG